MGKLREDVIYDDTYEEILDRVEGGETFSENVAFHDAQVKAILRKIDRRILPVLAVLYLMSFLDRTSSKETRPQPNTIYSEANQRSIEVGNADVAGLSETLQLSASQYNMALTIFFFPYALFEVPSNMVLKILRPSIWLPFIVLFWGTVMTLLGLVESYSGLLTTQFCLGLTESGLFPAASYILTLWYCRHEMQTRLAVFYCAASLAGAFSGLIAFGIQKLDGVAGLEGWRWIFILEGFATVALGLILPFVLYDSPEKARFLSNEERAILLCRLKLDCNTGGKDKETFKWKYLQQAISDWKIYLSVFVFWGNTITGYGFVFSLPRTIKELGYSESGAQLLTIPVYVFALVAVLIASYYSDKTKRRAQFIIYPYTLCALGFIIVMALPKDKWPSIRYIMLFPIAAGLYPSLVGVIAWNANNLAGTWKRSIGIALQITLGNLGGTVGSNIYLKSEAPTYCTGYGVSLAVLVAAIFAALVLRFGLDRINKQRDWMTTDEIYARYTPEELSEMGDQSPFFRYTL